MNLGPIISVISKVAEELTGNENLQKITFGTYADGRPRNLVDSVQNEYLSPKQKKKVTSGKKKKKKKDKKKNKNKFRL